MKKRIAIIADVHGNLEALESIIEDIKTQSIDEIICLGDSIGIGPNSKECIDLLIDNNIKSVLGNHEIYLLRGTDFDPAIVGEEKRHYNWVWESLTEKEINYIRKCPLYYSVNVNYEDSLFNKKYVLCHYLINDEKDIYPFEKSHLKEDISLWKKYSSDYITYFIGHLHNSFNINEVDGILTNIEIVDSAGCTKDEYTSYMILEISKTTKYLKRKIKYDRDKFINKLLILKYPDKQNILKYFYGIET